MDVERRRLSIDERIPLLSTVSGGLSGVSSPWGSSTVASAAQGSGGGGRGLHSRHGARGDLPPAPEDR